MRQSAYRIFTREKIRDRKELEIYWETIKAMFEGHTLRIFAIYGEYVDLEGNGRDRDRRVPQHFLRLMAIYRGWHLPTARATAGDA